MDDAFAGRESGPETPTASDHAAQFPTEWIGVPLAYGSQLGPYRIEASLGIGGMGQVFRARDTRLDRFVAIKILRSHLTGRQDLRHRFEREARATSALNHPHICTLYDIGEQDGLSYLVMECLEGETLAARLREGPLPLPLALRFAVQIADALAAAHAQGMIHRDLKPANLMVTPFGIKVLDFGLAKFTAVPEPDGSPEVTGLHAVVGTPAYMSPEQTRGEPLDERSDIFSLGSVFYEMLTGHAAFRGSSILATLHEIATVDPVLPSTLRPDLPPELDAILERALAKDRDRRYTASELSETLAALLTASDVVRTPLRERPPEALIGRDAELRDLRQSLQRVLTGSGLIVLLTGEPGIGKTALSRAFLYALRQEHPEVLLGRGSCVEQYGTGEAYLPFLEALSGILAGPGKERLVAVLRRHAPTWCLQFPAVFGSGSSRDQIQRQAIGATKERMLRELGNALDELTATSPVVLMLEDLHWADPSSIDLLRHLGQRSGGQRLLVVGTARPQDLERTGHPLKNCLRELLAHNACVELALGELGRDHIARLLDARFSPNAFPPDLADLLHRKTEGHPLFATGAIQLLAERADVQQSDGTWNLVRPLHEVDLAVPENIRSVIRKQIEVLDENERRLLQYAAIEGEEFTSTVLASLLGIDEVELEERLDRLDRVHRLIRTGSEEELPDGSWATRYRFAHALYQNLLYEELLPKRRTLLHRQAAAALERCYSGQTARVASSLASHFERGRDYPRAIHYLVQTAVVAAGRYANAAAAEIYSHALHLTAKLPVQEQPENRLVLHSRRGICRLVLTQYADAVADFERALEDARALGDPERECAALIRLSDTHFYAHEIDAMGRRANEALRLAERIGNQQLLSEALAHLARRQTVVGELGPAAELYDRGIRIARSLAHCPALPMQLIYRGVLYFFQSEYRRAEEVLSEGVALARHDLDGVNLPQGLLFLGMTRGNLGRISESLATLGEAQEISHRNGSKMVVAKTPNCIAWLHRELQDFEGALVRDRAAVETARINSVPEAEANSWINLAQDYIAMGRFDSAVEAMREAEGIRDRDAWHAWRFFGIRLQLARAEYWLAQGQPSQALGPAQRLLATCTSQGVPKYVVSAHLALAEIAAAGGQFTEAQSHLLAALEQLQERPAPLVAWKTYAILGRSHAGAGNAAAAREAFVQSASLVRQIAANTSDPSLQATFLSAPAVRAILQESDAPSSATR